LKEKLLRKVSTKKQKKNNNNNKKAEKKPADGNTPYTEFD